MERRAFLTGSVGALGTIAASSARAQPAASLPAGFVRLRVVPGELTVDGKVGKAYRIEREAQRLYPNRGLVAGEAYFALAV